MADLSLFDPNAAGNPNNNIFGLPFNEQDARLVLLPVPWEVTVSYKAGTARAPEHLFKASLQIDLHDGVYPDAWRAGYFMRAPEKKILLKSDYLRKEAELYINYISQGENISSNKFMSKALKEVNEGGRYLNQWVYEQSLDLLKAGKLVGLVGGDHSTPLGFLKAIAELHQDFGVLQIDAHADLRKGYEGFIYSHASIMYNALEEVPAVNAEIDGGDIIYKNFYHIGVAVGTAGATVISADASRILSALSGGIAGADITLGWTSLFAAVMVMGHILIDGKLGDQPLRNAPSLVTARDGPARRFGFSGSRDATVYRDVIAA